MNPMDRQNLPRHILLFIAGAVWVFLLLSLGSFHPTDLPSHAVDPYPPIGNLCGSVGAYIAYWCFVAMGQAVFPVLFFSGLLLVLVMCRSQVRDVWMRAVGLML